MFAKWLVGFLALFIGCSAVASELVLLPIRDLRQSHNGRLVRLLVTVDFDSCKYSYKGLYIEPLEGGTNPVRFAVRAFASENPSTELCRSTDEPRTDSLTFLSPESERYEFLPVQPK